MSALHGDPAPGGSLLRAVARVQRELTEIYRLDLDLRAEQFVVAPETARRLLPPGSPRSGLVVVQEPHGVSIGLYLDPEDENDISTVVEETSHLLYLAWLANRDFSVSRLLLELQGEVDRYAVARLGGRSGLEHFAHFSWADGMDADTRQRYAAAHHSARRYCRSLNRRFPSRSDTPALLTELRRFYRAPPHDKLNAA